MMFDLKGHIRLNKALYIYIFSSNNSSIKPLLSLYASLSFSLSHSSSLFLFFQPPLPSTPLHLCNNQPTAASDKKILRGTLAHRLSPLLPSPSLNLSMPLNLFSLSCSPSLFLFFHPSLHQPYIRPMPLYLFSLSFFFFHPPPTLTLALYPPYESLSFLSPSFFFFYF